MTPGHYLCVDESMNQWLGKGMPNVVKIPRKPHSIGQEYKTLADSETYCILRLDPVGDKTVRRFETQGTPKTIATVLRLTEPWFNSARTIIGDSLFGSPAMARRLLEEGLFSIMQVKKRLYWPRGMPQDDLVAALGGNFGAKVTKKATRNDIFVAAYQDLKPKALVASCGLTKNGDKVTRRAKDGQIKTCNRPAVFDEYSANKGT